MIIYQSTKFNIEPDKLSRLAVELAQYLIPHARLLDSKITKESVNLVLQEIEVLTAFNLRNGELGEEAFEDILKLASELESKRKKQGEASLKEINIYLLANRFLSGFLRRIPSNLAEIRLFEWSLIHSEANEAVFIREVLKGAHIKKISKELPQSPLVEHLPESQHFLHQELSTPELIAFARFGVELRGHRFKMTHPV